MWLYNRFLCYRYKIAFAIFTAMFSLGAAVQCIAQEKAGAAADAKRIRISSDLLTTDDEKGYAEFTGNVRAVQDEHSCS